MKYIFLATLLSVLGGNCQDTKGSSDLEASNLQGFLFIDISDIYHNGGQINILDESGEIVLSVVDKKITYEGSAYDLIEDEHLYSDSINSEAFFAEYGLFVLRCVGKSDKFYKAELNQQLVLIPVDSKHVEFKGLEKFILDTYPIPTQSNPLRVQPNENAEIISNYSDYTFIAVEVKGDWVKVKDDKECYPGESPSEKDIVGWIRWRKNGEFILKVAYTC